jgi:hypothetical protein
VRRSRFLPLYVLLVTAALLIPVVGVISSPPRYAIAVDPGTEPMSAVSAGLPFSFRLGQHEIVAVDSFALPYVTDVAAPNVPGLDREPVGVQMAVIGGRVVDHPVRQAQYALAQLNAFRVTGDPDRLQSARRQVDRLIDRGIHQGDAVFFPYPFAFDRHGDPGDRMSPPWYSAMAQGQALSAFVRLFEATGDPAYRVAADETFASFRNPGIPGAAEDRIWTVFIDADGYYWPEEYPAAIPDRTFNGMVFASFGLYDYHRLTGSADAATLFKAVMTTVLHVLPAIRVEGGLSRYCLGHAVQSPSYHAVHIDQLRVLQRLTGDAAFARWADLLLADHDPATDRARPGGSPAAD